MKHAVKILLGTIIVAGICYGLNTLRREKAPEQEQEIIRPVRTITLQGGRDSMTRRYFGTVQGGKRADLSFRVSGTLSKVNVEKGAAVKRGQLLATLDPRDFNTRVRQAQSSLAQAEAQYKNAQADFTRYENLYKQRVIARAQYDSYKTQVDVTKSAVATAEAGVKSARDALKDTELRAPFEGVITERTVENFQDVTAKQTIFTIQDLSALEVVFNIPDNDIILAPIPQVRSIADLQKNAGKYYTMNARFDAIPDKVFPLGLKEIAAQATAANTYPITAVMTRHDDVRILPGMAVTVEVNFTGEEKDGETESRYAVPTTAIYNHGGNNYVWRYYGGSVSRIQVNTGQINNDASVEIESAELRNGDIIVTAGVYFLHEGQHVRILEE